MLAAAVLALSLIAGLLLPVYTDEVGWRFQAARLPFDGGVDRFIAEACGPNTIARPPVFMLPFRYASAYLNLLFDSPAWVRIFGVVSALAWLALVWRLAGQVGGRLAGPLRTLGCTLAGLGVLPLLLVWSRPEQALLITVTLALIVATRAEPPRDRGGALRAAGAVLLVGLAALSYHLKGVVFLPIFLCAAAMSSRGAAGRWARVGAIAILCGCGLLALRYWTHRFACPADPVLARQLGRQNIGAMVLAYGYSDPAALAKAALTNLSPYAYIDLTLPGRWYMASWLPPAPTPELLLKAWRTAVRLGWGIGLLLFACGLAAGIYSAVRPRRQPPALILAVTVAGVALLWSASQMTKNAYEATIVLPLLLLAGVLALASPAPLRLNRWVARGAGAGVGAVAALSLASQMLAMQAFVPQLWRVAQRPGYVDDQWYSLVPWHYGAVAGRIAAAGRLCGIGPERRPRGVLIDDLTYFPYVRAYRPQHRLGVLSNWTGQQRDPIAYLRSKGSQGAVVGCRFLPPALRARAHSVGEICCLGPL